MTYLPSKYGWIAISGELLSKYNYGHKRIFNWVRDDRAAGFFYAKTKAVIGEM
jgi:hypothetical protein